MNINIKLYINYYDFFLASKNICLRGHLGCPVYPLSKIIKRNFTMIFIINICSFMMLLHLFMELEINKNILKLTKLLIMCISVFIYLSVFFIFCAVDVSEVAVFLYHPNN